MQLQAAMLATAAVAARDHHCIDQSADHVLRANRLARGEVLLQLGNGGAIDGLIGRRQADDGALRLNWLLNGGRSQQQKD